VFVSLSLVYLVELTPERAKHANRHQPTSRSDSRTRSLRNIETLARQKGTETKRAAVMSLCHVGHACVAFWRKGDENFWCRAGPGRGFEVSRGEGRRRTVALRLLGKQICGLHDYGSLRFRFRRTMLFRCARRQTRSPFSLEIRTPTAAQRTRVQTPTPS
jgi:hypothetical protein